MKTEVKEELLKLTDNDEDLVAEFEDKLNSTNRLIEDEGLITRRKPKVAKRKPGKRTIKIKSIGTRTPNLARIAQQSMATLAAKQAETLARLKRAPATKPVDSQDVHHLTLDEIELTNLSHLRKRQLRAAAITRSTHDGKSMPEIAHDSLSGLSRKYVDDD